MKDVQVCDVAENTESQKEFLTVAEAAKFLDLKVGSVYKMTASRTLPHYKPVARKIYFKRQELEEWILSGRISTIEEIQKEADKHCLKNRIR